MTAAKKSESCTATIQFASNSNLDAVEASLITEDVKLHSSNSKLEIVVSANSLTDLRARLNSTLRSLQAASESLIEADLFE